MKAPEQQTKAFLAFSDTGWNRWPAGPYLIERQGDGNLLGGTGLAFETPTVAATGMYSLEMPGDTDTRPKR